MGCDAAYDSAKGEVFVGNSVSGTNDVSVISDASNTVVATMDVGNEPYALAYDPGKGEVFVASYSNGADGTVSSSSSLLASLGLDSSSGSSTSTSLISQLLGTQSQDPLLASLGSASSGTGFSLLG